ncbi:hypothetical protein LEA_09554, partial [human gut metagenome]
VGRVQFDPERESMTIIATLMHWTVGVENGRTERLYAIAADDLSELDSMSRSVGADHMPGLTFTSADDRYVKPRLR